MADDLKRALDHYAAEGDYPMVHLIVQAMVEDFYRYRDAAMQEVKVAKFIKSGLDGFRPLAAKYGLNVPELKPLSEK